MHDVKDTDMPEGVAVSSLDPVANATLTHKPCGHDDVKSDGPTINLGAFGGNVVAVFDRDVKILHITSESARELAALLVKYADKVDAS